MNMVAAWDFFPFRTIRHTTRTEHDKSRPSPLQHNFTSPCLQNFAIPCVYETTKVTHWLDSCPDDISVLVMVIWAMTTPASWVIWAAMTPPSRIAT
ncbi:hypothetical protein V1264_007635 [Littorina saxatilis]|uniref:Uncharacterized protein n=1 Tax=Littorina saxatilis TaxID=31220 RepID=A0AAN9AVD9_9CAEN